MGPDGISGHVLRACAFQLAGFFNRHFQSVPLSVCGSRMLQKSTIVPIPKKNKITCLNDWRPIALTPIFSKCFEKLVRDYICSVLPASLDPLQFAYRKLTVPQTMLLPSHCRLLSPTWKIRTPIGAFPLHGTARYGSLLGGFPLGTVPGTFLVPPQPRFQAIRTVTKT